jgi:hypothetical protein
MDTFPSLKELTVDTLSAVHAAYRPDHPAAAAGHPDGGKQRGADQRNVLKEFFL